MRLLMSFSIFFLTLNLYSQTSNNQFSITYPELSMRIYNIPFVMNCNAKRATLNLTSENKMMVGFNSGKIIFYFDNGKLVKRESYNSEGFLEESLIFEYYINGNLKSTLTKNNVCFTQIQTIYKYNEENKLVSKSHADINILSSPAVTNYYYDKDGLITGFENENYATELFYKNKLLIRKIVKNLADNYGETTKFLYDKQGILTGEETKNIRNVKYQYDDKGKIISIYLDNQNTIYGKLDIIYDGKNNIIKFGEIKIDWEY